MLSTSATGSAAQINTYDEFGVPGLTNTGRFQYTGQIWLPEIGMYHYKTRVYSPTLGRFLQTDPVGYQDQVNLYTFVGNDPVNGVDPTGMVTAPCGDRSGVCDSDEIVVIGEKTANQSAILTAPLEIGRKISPIGRFFDFFKATPTACPYAFERCVMPNSSKSVDEIIDDLNRNSVHTSGPIRDMKPGSQDPETYFNHLAKASTAQAKSYSNGAKVVELKGGGQAILKSSTGTTNHPGGQPTLSVQNRPGTSSTKYRWQE